MNARPRPTQSEFFEPSSLLKPPAEAPAIRLVDDQFPSWQPSVGSLVPLGRVSSLVPLRKLGRLYPLAFARYLIAFSIGVAVAFTWQSYGHRPTRDWPGRDDTRDQRPADFRTVRSSQDLNASAAPGPYHAVKARSAVATGTDPAHSRQKSLNRFGASAV